MELLVSGNDYNILRDALYNSFTHSMIINRGSANKF